MNGEDLPAGSCALRRAKPKEVRSDPPSAAFFLKPNEIGISLQWIRQEPTTPVEARIVARELLLRSLGRIDGDDWILELAVDRARDKLSSSDFEALRLVRFLFIHMALSDGSINEEHAEIRGLADLEEQRWQMAAQLIASAVVQKAKWKNLR